jgi:hypothetical protein
MGCTSYRDAVLIVGHRGEAPTCTFLADTDFNDAGKEAAAATAAACCSKVRKTPSLPRSWANSSLL